MWHCKQVAKELTRRTEGDSINRIANILADQLTQRCAIVAEDLHTSVFAISHKNSPPGIVQTESVGQEERTESWISI